MHHSGRFSEPSATGRHRSPMRAKRFGSRQTCSAAERQLCVTHMSVNLCCRENRRVALASARLRNSSQGSAPRRILHGKDHRPGDDGAGTPLPVPGGRSVGGMHWQKAPDPFEHRCTGSDMAP